MSKYKGLFTFDVENHRYVSVIQADGIVTEMDYRPEPEPTEPLIEDEEARGAVRSWASSLQVNVVRCWKRVSGFGIETTTFVAFSLGSAPKIEFTSSCLDADVADGGTYTIAELCGEEEAPEPIEPTFVDLDERIKEKEEE